MTISPEALYMRLGDVVASMPDLRSSPSAPETIAWLGKAYALIAMLGDVAENMAWKHAVGLLSQRGQTSEAARAVSLILYRALAVAELKAPASIQGAFIPVGNVFDAMAMVGKVLQEAQQDLLFVDPYMDEKALTDFALLSPENVKLRLLADQQGYKATLKPAVARWTVQYGVRRPIEARLTTPKMLHDRLIVVDGMVAWTLTQSFNAMAARSPASIMRVDLETAALKIAAYGVMWQAARSL